MGKRGDGGGGVDVGECGVEEGGGSRGEDCDFEVELGVECLKCRYGMTMSIDMGSGVGVWRFMGLLL